MVKYSRKIKDACEEYNMSYFDTSKDFMAALENVKKYLLSEN
jgi:hypothetical protein